MIFLVNWYEFNYYPNHSARLKRNGCILGVYPQSLFMEYNDFLALNRDILINDILKD